MFTAHRYGRTVTSALLLASGVAAGLALQARAQALKPADLARAARDLLQKRCLACHGESGGSAGVYVLDRPALLRRKVVVPNSGASLLLVMVDKGRMPLGGPVLTVAEKKTLRDWVMAGAPDWVDARRPRTAISEVSLLRAIQDDLQKPENAGRQQQLRYYSLAHLHNNSQVPDEELAAYRLALSKLLNSLSWKGGIRPAQPVDGDQALLRIDLRDYDWNPATWKRVVAAYPYGLIHRDVSAAAAGIRALSGADVPYIRADWFVAQASQAPLYDELLDLPETVQGLEKKLEVDTRRNLAERHDVVRAGMQRSGVSVNNRVVERHVTKYGAYWKSYDFSGNDARRGIFKNPLDLHADGGEFIFHLPNGLQAYMIVDGQERRIPAAPVSIVRDPSARDGTVRNGRSCMGCHFQGMNAVPDRVRPFIENEGALVFDRDRALELYPPQSEIDRLIALDNERFKRAVVEAAQGLPPAAAVEPIAALARLYEQDLDLPRAAAETGLAPADFERRVRNRNRLTGDLGFGELLRPEGVFKRDAWEHYFADVAKELALARTEDLAYLSPQAAPVVPPRDTRLRVAFGTLAALDPRDAAALKEALLFWLGRNPDLVLVEDPAGADIVLRGRVAFGASRQDALVSVGGQLKPPGATEVRTVQRDFKGPLDDPNVAGHQLANNLSFELTNRWLPIPRPEERFEPRHEGAVRAAQPLQEVAAPAQSAVVGASPSPRLSLALFPADPPQGTFRVGEEIELRFSVTQPAFVTVVNVDAGGGVTRLFPAPGEVPERLQPGQVYHLGGPKDPLKRPLEIVDGALGTEYFIAIATPEKLDLPDDVFKAEAAKGERPVALKVRSALDRPDFKGKLAFQRLQFFTAPRRN